MTKITELHRDSSSSFTEENEETRVRRFAKHMLKSTLFIGSFQEKRFVEPLNSYRDVIKVADDETDFIENLIAVKKRCAKFYVKNWIGITEPKTIGAPAGYNLWVTLDEEVFGSYWYKVKTVEFFSDEVRLRLEVVRPVSKERTPVHNITPQQILEDITQHDFNDLSVKVGNYFKETCYEVFKEALNMLTFTNIKDAIVFLVLLLSTLITFLVHVIKYLLEYFLKLLHETSGFVKVCTPITITFMKLIMNSINGFYALIAVMWRDRTKPTVNQNLYQIMPPQSPYYNIRALPYPGCEGDVSMYPRSKNYPSSVKITPLDDY